MIKGKKKSNEKKLVIITAVVLVAVVMYTGVIEPQMIRRKESIQKKQQLQLDLTRMKADMLLRDRIEKKYAQLKSMMQSAGTDQQEISRFSRELNDIYTKLPVKIKTIKILPLQEERFYKKFSIKAEMTGDIRNIITLIKAIESTDSPIRIEQLDLKAQGTPDKVLASFLLTKVTSRETNSQEVAG